MEVMSSSGLALVQGDKAKSDLKVRFSEPASHWTDAIPIGNGCLGAMVWGGVVSETLNLNEDTLWTGIPRNYTNPNAVEVLSEVRKLIYDGNYVKATIAGIKLGGDFNDSYQLLGDIKLEFDPSHAKYDPKTYQRELDLNTATAKLKYSVDGVEFTREHFCSYSDQVMVVNISGNKPGSVAFTVSLDSQLKIRTYVNEQNQIVMEGSCSGKTHPPVASLRKTTENDDDLKGIHFTTILDLQISNNVGAIHKLEDGKLKIEGADSAIIRLVASSSFDGPFVKPSDSKRDPTSDSLKKLITIKDLSYDEIYARHLEDYQSLFHRVSLQLSKISKRKENIDLDYDDDAFVSTAERIKSFQSDEDPSLVALLFQFGRYLLISCSRPKTQPANLQGIWNNSLHPSWGSVFTANINLEMNYWPSLPCNLQECQEPLFDYIANLSINGTKTAEVNYKARGWVSHHALDIWAKSDAQKEFNIWGAFANWPMSGGWLCTHLWEHYAYTMDKDFLEKKAYPLLEGCALFFLDWLIEGKRGYIETSPSASPEHFFIAPNGERAGLSYSSTMDISILKEVFSAVISAAEVLGKSQEDLVKRVQNALPRLPPVKIAADGAIMEWAEEFKDPEVTHRHMSHLFGLYPGHIITPEKTPDLCKAAAYSIHKRGEEGPGWSTAWKTALWARLHDSENAYTMIKHMFELIIPEHEKLEYHTGLYSNLFASHPPFQIDANFGICAALAEMIVQSTIEDLYILPALPKDKWPNGCVKGLKARGGVTVNIDWNDGELHEVGICSETSNTIEKILHYGGITETAKISPGKVYIFNKNLKCVKVQEAASL